MAAALLLPASGQSAGSITINGTTTINTLNNSALNFSSSSTFTTLNLASIATTATFNTNLSSSITFSGATTLSSHIMTGSGTLTLTGANTYTGTTTINNNGTLSLGSGATLSGNVLVNGGTLSLSGGGNVTGNILLNSGSVVLSNGTLVTAGNTGTITGGTINIIGNWFWDALVDGNTRYPLPGNAQTAQLGAPCDFMKFRQSPFVLHTNTSATILTTGTLRLIGSSTRPLATPPASLMSFADNDSAPTALVTAADGTVYGVAPGGGVDGAGQVVRVDFAADGSATLTALADFSTATTGAQPHGPLRLDAQGRILGLTRSGAANGKGGIFRFDPASNALDVVFAFPADLIGVANALVLAHDGNLYGTSSVLAEQGEIHRPLSTGYVINYGNYGGVITVNNTTNNLVLNNGSYGGTITLNNATNNLVLTGNTGLVTNGVGNVVLTTNNNTTLTGLNGTLGNLTVVNGGTLTLGNPVSNVSNLAPREAAPAEASAALTTAGAITYTGVTSSGANNLTIIGYPYNYQNPILAVGAGVPQHGSIFRLASTGEFAVLKIFGDGEVEQVNLLAGPEGNGATTFAGTAKAYFPCNLGETPVGDLLCWVSGGLYRQPEDGSDGQWVRAPAPVLNGYPIYYLNQSYLFNTLSPGPWFGSVSGMEVILRDEAPPMETLPGGNLLLGRDHDEWEMNANGFSSSLASPSRAAATEPAQPGEYTATRNLRGPVFPFADGRYRFENKTPGNVGVTATENGRGRPLADFADLRCGTLLPAISGAPDLLVVARSRETGATPALYRIERTDDHAPVVQDTSLYAENGTLNNGVRVVESDPVWSATDPNDDPISLTAVSAPTHGTTELISASQFRYTAPEPLAHDAFTYTADDGHGATAIGHITVIGSAPLAGDDHAEALGLDGQGRALYRVRPLLNDIDADGAPLSAFVALDPAIGSVTTDGDAFIFALAQPATARTVDYALSNGDRLSVGHIALGNHAPVAGFGVIFTNRRGVGSIELGSFASDPDGDALTGEVTTAPERGVVTVSGTTFIYQAVSGAQSSDQFTVTVRDPLGAMTDVLVSVYLESNDIQGTFNGLVSDGTHAAGALRLVSGINGRATAQLQIGRLLFRGVIDLPRTGSLTMLLLGPGGLKLPITITRNGSAFTASATFAGRSYDVTLSGEAFAPSTIEPAQYNVILTGDASLPARYGFALLRQKADGTVTATGRTPNGAAWSSGGVFDSSDNFAIFAPLAPDTGMLAGTLHRNATGPAITGDFDWPATGATTPLSASGTRYVAPATGQNVFGETQSRVRLKLTPQRLAPVQADFAVDARSRAQRTTIGVPAPQLSFTPASGLFHGTIMLRGHTTEIFGLLQGNTANGAGMLVGRNGNATLEPAP